MRCQQLEGSRGLGRPRTSLSALDDAKADEMRRGLLDYMSRTTAQYCWRDEKPGYTD